MTQDESRAEAMTEILSEIGLEYTSEQVKQIVEDYDLHIEMEQEINSYQFRGSSDNKCSKCNTKDTKIETLQKQINTYSDSVKTRRNASNVWIENDSVMYD